MLKLQLMLLLTWRDDSDASDDGCMQQSGFHSLLQQFTRALDGQKSKQRILHHACAALKLASHFVLLCLSRVPCFSAVCVSSSTSASSSSATSNDSSSGRAQLVFELSGLLSSASRSLRLSSDRRVLLGACMAAAHHAAGGIEDDMQLRTPLATTTTPYAASSTAAASSSAVAAQANDPWLLLEGVNSSPLIDALYDQTKSHSTTARTAAATAASAAASVPLFAL